MEERWLRPTLYHIYRITSYLVVHYTRVFCHPTLSYIILPPLTTSILPHPTLYSTAILLHWILLQVYPEPHPISSYTRVFCHPTLSYIILPPLTTSNHIPPHPTLYFVEYSVGW